KADKKIYYVNDEKQQAQYIRMFKDNGMDAVILNTMIDSHFISFMESENRDVKFLRVDADIIDNMKDDQSKEDENKKLQEKLEKIIKEATGKDKLKIKVEGLKSESTPAVILLTEESRRFREMSRSFGGNLNTADLFPDEETLVLNSNNTMVKRIADLYQEEDRKEDAITAACHIYDLALLNHRQLEPEDMVKFIERSNTLLMRLL
ncbi:MAG: molecular chaperone HtpG, partial [Acetivibrionales bacterium]